MNLKGFKGIKKNGNKKKNEIFTGILKNLSNWVIHILLFEEFERIKCNVEEFPPMYWN